MKKAKKLIQFAGMGENNIQNQSYPSDEGPGKEDACLNYSAKKYGN